MWLEIISDCPDIWGHTSSATGKFLRQNMEDIYPEIFSWCERINNYVTMQSKIIQLLETTNDVIVIKGC